MRFYCPLLMRSYTRQAYHAKALRYIGVACTPPVSERFYRWIGYSFYLSLRRPPLVSPKALIPLPLSQLYSGKSLTEYIALLTDRFSRRTDMYAFSVFTAERIVAILVNSSVGVSGQHYLR